MLKVPRTATAMAVKRYIAIDLRILGFLASKWVRYGKCLLKTSATRVAELIRRDYYAKRILQTCDTLARMTHIQSCMLAYHAYRMLFSDRHDWRVLIAAP